MSTAWLRIEALGRKDGPAWLLGLAFGIYAASLLTSLGYNFDEGVYIQQVRLMLDGQRPYIDFFYHQTPLYPFTLMAAGWFSPDSLFAYRLPSLIATVLCGILVYRIARPMMPWGAALFAALIFYFAPLQYFGLLALPNALMSFFATAGVYLVWFRPNEQARQQAPLVSTLAGLLLGASILYKPLSLPIALAVGMAVLLSRQARSRAIWLIVGAASIGFGTWALFHWTSGGQFTQVLELQAARYSGQSGFDVMSGFEPFRQAMEQRGVDSPFGWNLAEHKFAFLAPAPHANLPVAAMALAGQLILWSRWGARASPHRLVLSLWWALPFVFCLVVWEPSWDHYFVLYLPPLSILAALFVWRLWSARKARHVARIIVVLLTVYVTVVGTGILWARRLDYDSLAKPAQANESWLLFDPFLNFVTGTRPACGLIDPFNVFGRRSLVGSSARSGLGSNYEVSAIDLTRCLQQETDIRIGTGGLWSTWFVDGALKENVERLPKERFFELWQGQL
jgi:4-amino-4-deoxy-L-arabinose transferase-like glycosyltransferase